MQQEHFNFNPIFSFPSLIFKVCKYQGLAVLTPRVPFLALPLPPLVFDLIYGLTKLACFTVGLNLSFCNAHSSLTGGSGRAKDSDREWV